MKQKQNARQKREAETRKRKGVFSVKTAVFSAEGPEKPDSTIQVVRCSAEVLSSKSPEDETREFLDYLDRYGTPPAKDDLPGPARKKPNASATIPRLNLEEGMPVVDEAIDRMRMGVQEMSSGGMRTVKLIHGYGSTGRGGKIRAGVRKELASMKRKKLIRDYIPGEDFGPVDDASRKLAEQQKAVTRDPDYGRINPGITVVLL